MPDASTDTGDIDDFIILSKEDYKKLDVEAKKQYKIDLENYKIFIKEQKREASKIKRGLYMREYYRDYHKMKLKYDKAYHQRQNECALNLYYEKKYEKHQIIAEEKAKHLALEKQELYNKPHNKILLHMKVL